MNYFPVAVKLKNKKVVVAGGGKVAERKIKSLIKTGAKIKVISPRLTSRIESFVKKGLIKWVPRCIRPSDINSATLIIAATNSDCTNRDVSHWARKRKLLVNVVDFPILSNFISPAIFKVRKTLVTVYTDGKEPRLSRDLKNYLKKKWNDFLYYRSRL